MAAMIRQVLSRMRLWLPTAMAFAFVVCVLNLWGRGLVAVANPWNDVTTETCVYAGIAAVVFLAMGIVISSAAKCGDPSLATSVSGVAHRLFLASLFVALGAWNAWIILEQGRWSAAFTYHLDAMRVTTALLLAVGYLAVTVPDKHLLAMLGLPTKPTGQSTAQPPAAEPSASVMPEAPPSMQDDRYRRLSVDLLNKVPPDQRQEALMRYAQLAFEDAFREPVAERRDAQVNEIVGLAYAMPPERQHDAVFGILDAGLKMMSPQQILAYRRNLVADPKNASEPSFPTLLNLIDGHLALNQILSAEEPQNGPAADPQ